MAQDNPKALKHFVGEEVLRKYFFNVQLSSKDMKTMCLQLLNIELKPRVRFIATELRRHLPDPYPLALAELLKITRTQDLRSFECWPATEFIQIYGLDHIEESLTALYELTSRFTSEYSVRPFINRYHKPIYQKLSQWTSDPDEHIRRWVSEGTRPRLPWGEKLNQAVMNPTLGLELLEALRFDGSLYVRKSVANHLNDIAKDHPEKVVQTLSRWSKEVPPSYEKEFQFIVHRALRTLVKDGHRGALGLLGVGSNERSFKVSPLKLKKNKVRMRESLDFSFSLANSSSKQQNFIVDYVIYFKKANGSLSPKVFKLKKLNLKSNERVHIEKKHTLKKITTRVYYSGLHKLALKVNGLEQKPLKFILK